MKSHVESQCLVKCFANLRTNFSNRHKQAFHFLDVVIHYFYMLTEFLLQNRSSFNRVSDRSANSSQI